MVLPDQQYTELEKKNMQLVREYMSIVYSAEKDQGPDSVRHLCNPSSTFEAQTTFPGVNTLEEYAEAHREYVVKENKKKEETNFK